MALATPNSTWVVKFDSDGNHMPYDNGHHSVYNRYVNAHYSFNDTLRYHDYERGRSSIQIIFKGSTGRKYVMMFSDFMKVVTKLENGTLSGTWAFSKQGSSTGIVLVSK